MFFIKKFFFAFISVLCVLIIPFSVSAAPADIPGYKIVYPNGEKYDKSLYYYVPKDDDGRYEYGVTDLKYLPPFPKDFFNYDFTPRYVIFKSGQYYYLCYNTTFFKDYDKNRLIDFRGSNQPSILFYGDINVKGTYLKVYRYDSTQYVEGWQFMQSTWGYPIPIGSQFVYSSTDLLSCINGTWYCDDSHDDYVYITLALSKFQKVYYDYIEQLVPVGVVIFTSLIILKIFKKRKRKPKNKIRRRLPKKWRKSF